MVGRIEVSLVKGGFKVTRDSVAGRQAVIGRSGRLRPGLHRHLFVLVAVFKAGMAGVEHLERFTDEAGQYAATVKTGRVSGARAVAVAVVEAAEEGSEGWALAPGERRSGRSPTFAVLVDLAGARVVCAESPDDLRRLAGVHVVPSLRLV